MLTQGHHFKDWAAPENVGYKAVAVNASDVAAMGGTPRFVLTSGGAPDPETALRCFEGVVEACERFGVYPLGGDTTRADALTVDVAILGELAHATGTALGGETRRPPGRHRRARRRGGRATRPRARHDQGTIASCAGTSGRNRGWRQDAPPPNSARAP